jgi:hypothetical protein
MSIVGTTSQLIRCSIALYSIVLPVTPPDYLLGIEMKRCNLQGMVMQAAVSQRIPIDTPILCLICSS